MLEIFDDDATGAWPEAVKDFHRLHIEEYGDDESDPRTIEEDFSEAIEAAQIDACDIPPLTLR